MALRRLTKRFLPCALSMDHTPHPVESPNNAGYRGWIVSALVSGLAATTSALLLWSVNSAPVADDTAVVVTPAKGTNVELPVEGVADSLPAVELPVEAALRVPAAPETSDEINTPEMAPTVDDRALRLLGCWTLNDHIQRRIELRPDGTATMQVKLDAISAFFYGSELTLEVTWTLQGNTLTYVAISGNPAENVARLLRDHGATQVYTIIEFEENRVLLELEKDQTRYDWHREQS